MSLRGTNCPLPMTGFSNEITFVAPFGREIADVKFGEIAALSCFVPTNDVILHKRKTQLIAKIKLTFIKSVRIGIFVGRCDSACIIRIHNKSSSVRSGIFINANQELDIWLKPNIPSIFPRWLKPTAIDQIIVNFNCRLL